IRLQARAARTQLAQPRELYVADGLAVPGAAGEFDFRLPGNLPVDQFNVALPELNSVARVTLSVSEANAGPWRPIATTSVYRLASGTGETRNTARSVGLIQRPYWRMRVEQPAGVLGKLAPRLQVGWVPHELVFIARGEPPFRLAYGSATVESAEVRLADIVPGLGREIPLAVVIADPEEVLGGPARLVAAAKPFDWRSALLWISLVLGVLLLGWMAFRLMRDMNPPADD
ncbi:MAG: DUF3999 family protein, partial [Pseudomonadales bacterium]|nr:DUF3999 family protein [Pseudomonadales bacterium]